MIFPAASKIALLISGLFLLNGMITGVWKYAKIMSSSENRAPVYVDIAHRTSFFYSFASLVLSALIYFSPFGAFWQLVMVGFPLAYFIAAVVAYMKEGYLDRTENMFSERNVLTTYFMYTLIVGEIGGLVFILGGFIYTQFVR